MALLELYSASKETPVAKLFDDSTGQATVNEGLTFNFPPLSAWPCFRDHLTGLSRATMPSDNSQSPSHQNDPRAQIVNQIETFRKGEGHPYLLFYFNTAGKKDFAEELGIEAEQTSCNAQEADNTTTRELVDSNNSITRRRPEQGPSTLPDKEVSLGPQVKRMLDDLDEEAARHILYVMTTSLEEPYSVLCRLHKNHQRSQTRGTNRNKRTSYLTPPENNNVDPDCLSEARDNVNTHDREQLVSFNVPGKAAAPSTLPSDT